LSPDGQLFALVNGSSYIAMIPKTPSAQALFYRSWVLRPDLAWHQDQVRELQKNKNAPAAAMHLGWYLGGQDHFALTPGPDAPAFDRGGVYAGLLQKVTGPALARVQAEAAKAVAMEPNHWQSHAIAGAAFYRAGNYPMALEALNKALKLRGKHNIWLAAHLGMTHAKLEQADKAKEWLSKLRPAADSSWEEAALEWLLRPEVQQALPVPVKAQAQVTRLVFQSAWRCCRDNGPFGVPAWWKLELRGISGPRT
jgi:tetratricopeptide (TPR) repeat protein